MRKTNPQWQGIAIGLTLLWCAFGLWVWGPIGLLIIAGLAFIENASSK